MSFLLMVFLALVCVWSESYRPSPWQGTPGQAVLLTLLTVLLLGLHAFWISRRVYWPLQRDPYTHLHDQLLDQYDRSRFIHQFIQFAAFGIALVLLGWGWAIRQIWSYDGTPLPGLELLTLAPFLLGQIVSWAFFYDADRAAHRAAQQLDLDPFGQIWLETRQTAPRPFGGRWAYVAFQLRQKFALVLIPVFLLIARQELLRLLPETSTQWPFLMNALAVLSMALVFVGMPIFIRLALGLQSLPKGQVRDRLLASAKRLGFRCSDVLIWNTRNGMANAMVIGLVPWLRYVVFTDRLIEEFTEDEIEAVFGHEIGHVRHQHLLLYLTFLVSSMLALGILADHYVTPTLVDLGETIGASFPSLAKPLSDWFLPVSDVSSIAVLFFLLAYVFVVFGYLSRKCERQADVFGCRAVSCTQSECFGHDCDTPLSPRGKSLCRSGILTFIRALEKVALINGISRDRPGFLQSWQHSTIARRVDFLQQVLGDPSIESNFQRRLFRLKLGLIGALWILLAGLIYLRGWNF